MGRLLRFEQATQYNAGGQKHGFANRSIAETRSLLSGRTTPYPNAVTCSNVKVVIANKQTKKVLRVQKNIGNRGLKKRKQTHRHRIVGHYSSRFYGIMEIARRWAR